MLACGPQTSLSLIGLQQALMCMQQDLAPHATVFARSHSAKSLQASQSRTAVCALLISAALCTQLRCSHICAIESARVARQRTAGAACGEMARTSAQAVLGDARGRVHEFDLRRPGSAVSLAQHQAHADCVRRLAFAPDTGVPSQPRAGLATCASAVALPKRRQPGQAVSVAGAGRVAQTLSFTQLGECIRLALAAEQSRHAHGIT